MVLKVLQLAYFDVMPLPFLNVPPSQFYIFQIFFNLFNFPATLSLKTSLIFQIITLNEIKSLALVAIEKLNLPPLLIEVWVFKWQRLRFRLIYLSLLEMLCSVGLSSFVCFRLPLLDLLNRVALSIFLIKCIFSFA